MSPSGLQCHRHFSIVCAVLSRFLGLENTWIESGKSGCDSQAAPMEWASKTDVFPQIVIKRLFPLGFVAIVNIL
jgi:hypothetical protein